MPARSRASFLQALAGGEEVRLVGFGVKNRPDRTWRKPGTGRWMQVKASGNPTMHAMIRNSTMAVQPPNCIP